MEYWNQIAIVLCLYKDADRMSMHLDKNGKFLSYFITVASFYGIKDFLILMLNCVEAGINRLMCSPMFIGQCIDMYMYCNVVVLIIQYYYEEKV